MSTRTEDIGSYQIDAELNASDRVRFLRQNALDAKANVCIDRAKYYTESWLQTEGEPIVIRRAKALEYFLARMSIYILDGELIVGNVASSPRGSVFAPEFGSDWIGKEIYDPKLSPDVRPYDNHIFKEEYKEFIMKEVVPHWEGHTVEAEVLRKLDPETAHVSFPAIYPDFETSPYGVELHLRHGNGHICVNYERVVKEGILATSEKIKEKLAALDEGETEKRNLYEAMLITHRAFINWAKRYADLALEKAETETDPVRKQELLQIADSCSYVPTHPARTLQEAFQSVWFVHCMVYGLEQETTAVSTGRMDQYLLPYYEADMAAGRTNKDKALELFELFFIKTSHMSILWDYQSAAYFAGFSLTQDVTCGGLKKDGTDGTNDLTYMILEAEKQMALYQPEVAARIHKNSPQEYLLKIAEVIRMGHGKPKLFVDDTAMSMMMARGISLEDARNYCIVGCVENAVPGASMTWPSAVQFNVAKCLELALNEGVCLLSGKQLGPKTPDPKTFTSFDDVLDAFQTQLAYFVKHLCASLKCIIETHSELTPYPFQDSIIDGCVESGKDLNCGGTKYSSVGLNGIAVPDTGDSLAAIKKLVFEDKKISMSELVDALRTDFEGKEDLRLTLQNKAPKYGNDEDYADLLVRKAGQMFAEECHKHPGPNGIQFAPGGFTVSSNVPYGMVTGALPSGRKAGTPLANGGISATNGSDQKGPTAVMRSASKFDNQMACNGTLLNLRFSPSTLKEERDIAKFASLIRSYTVMGGYHIQFNVISNALLKKAQKNPEKYPNLLVRVAGYSAYFTELSKEVQDDLIARTIHDEIA